MTTAAVGEPSREPLSVAALAAAAEQMLPGRWRGLRADLKLHRGPSDEWNEPTWTLEDPVDGGLYRLGRDEHDLVLCLVVETNLSNALSRYRNQHGALPSLQQLLPFLAMLQQQQLHAGAVDVSEAKPSLSQRLKQLMFLRIPLLKPDSLLETLLPIARLLSSQPLLWLYGLLGIIGLLRATPQWEALLASGGYLLTPQGAIAFFLCLAVTKVLHEFAHGFSAKAKGLYVPEMGVMLILLWPILYTNTSQAWKLTDRRQRFLIDSAGIRFELALAALALFFWGFVGPGLLRNLLFFIAGAALVTTLFVNLNPLMRFDGYYMLMDAWRTDNLQPRSLALAQHKMRRLLWDWQAGPPEQHPQPRRLALFGAATFSYRLIIGFTLSAVVYSFLSAELGALAFTLVFALLVVSPLVTEIRQLHEQRALFGRPWRVLLSLVAIFGLIALLTVPFSAKTSLPAMVMLADELSLTAREEGVLASPLPQVGDAVAAGETLTTITSPTLQFERQQLELDIQVQQAHMNSLTARGEQGALRTWLLADIERLEQRLATFDAAERELDIIAPRAATVVAINDRLKSGDAVARGSHLLTLSGENTGLQVQALLSFSDANHLSDDDLSQAEVRFGDAHTKPVAAQLKSRLPYQPLPRDSLFDTLGGPIASIETDGERRPRDAFQSLTYALQASDASLAHGQNVRLWITGKKRSVFGRISDVIARQLAGDGVL